MLDHKEKDLIGLLPEFIKLEMLKEQITKVYKLESELTNCYKKEYEENSYLYGFSRDNLENHNLADNFGDFLRLFKLCEISEDSLKKLYKFCKLLRKELNLEDNLYNAPTYMVDYGVVIGSKELTEKVNKEVNKLNFL